MSGGWVLCLLTALSCLQPLLPQICGFHKIREIKGEKAWELRLSACCRTGLFPFLSFPIAVFSFPINMRFLGFFQFITNYHLTDPVILPSFSSSWNILRYTSACSLINLCRLLLCLCCLVAVSSGDACDPNLQETGFFCLCLSGFQNYVLMQAWDNLSNRIKLCLLVFYSSFPPFYGPI